MKFPPGLVFLVCTFVETHSWEGHVISKTHSSTNPVDKLFMFQDNSTLNRQPSFGSEYLCDTDVIQYIQKYIYLYECMCNTSTLNDATETEEAEYGQLTNYSLNKLCGTMLKVEEPNWSGCDTDVRVELSNLTYNIYNSTSSWISYSLIKRYLSVS